MLYQKTVAMGGVDNTANPVTGFKQCDMEWDTPFLCLAREAIAGGEACNAAANDNGAFGLLVHDDTWQCPAIVLVPHRSFSQASSANMLMNFG